VTHHRYTTSPRTTDISVLLPAAVALTGRLDASWGAAVGSLTNTTATALEESVRSLFDAIGLPPHTYPHDVQHWFYASEWLEPLAQRLELVWGSIAAAVCGPTRAGGTEAFARQLRLSPTWRPQAEADADHGLVAAVDRQDTLLTVLARWHMFETVLSLSFALNQTAAPSIAHVARLHLDPRSGVPMRSQFVNTDEALLASGLGALRSHSHDQYSSGELLLRHYTADLKESALAFLDEPSRPVWTWREPSWVWPAASRPNRSHALRMLICESRHVPLAVCSPLQMPFYCDSGRNVVLAAPSCESNGRQPTATVIHTPVENERGEQI